MEQDREISGFQTGGELDFSLMALLVLLHQKDGTFGFKYKRSEFQAAVKAMKMGTSDALRWVEAEDSDPTDPSVELIVLKATRL